MQLIGGTDGAMWLVSRGFDSMVGAVAYDGERWLAPVDTGITATGAASPDGSVWMFGLDLDRDEKVVLYRLEDGVLTPQPAPEGGFECVYCGAYDVDADGTFWRYAKGVIHRFDGVTWTVFQSDPTDLAGTTDESAWQLGVDGSHWIIGRSEDGPTPWSVARIRPDGVTRMPLGAGTEDADEIQGRVRAMTGDANGRLWLEVDGYGLVCIDVDTRTVTEYGTETLPSLEFSDLDAAPDGSVWVATDAGITRIVTGG
jgi:sugar lactone lactonase YvrE